MNLLFSSRILTKKWCVIIIFSIIMLQISLKVVSSETSNTNGNDGLEDNLKYFAKRISMYNNIFQDVYIYNIHMVRETCH
jgi:hypothetical protein